MSLTVMHVEAGRHLYGGALQVFYLMRELQGMGVNNLLLCPPQSEIAKASASFAQVIETPMRGDLDLGLSLRINRIAKIHQVNVLHAHSRRGADLYTGIAADISKIPSVLTRRVDNPESPWFAKYKARKFKKVTAISEGIRQVMLKAGVPEDHVVTIHSAVDREKFQPNSDRSDFCTRFDIQEEQVVVGVIAQLIERKGHRFLFDIAPQLIKKHPQLKIIIFGKGPERASLEAQVNKLGIDDNIAFAGFQADMENIIPHFDLVVHPALMEGLGVSLLQASACAVPIVAAASGGIPEIVRDKENGFLVPAADSERLFTSIDTLLSNKELRIQFGKRGREIIENEFSTRVMAQAYFDLYQSIA